MSFSFSFSSLGSYIITLLWILLNVFSSVAIILLNKYLLRSCSCNYALSLTSLHFFFNAFLQYVLRNAGFEAFQLPKSLTNKGEGEDANSGGSSIRSCALSVLDCLDPTQLTRTSQTNTNTQQQQQQQDAEPLIATAASASPPPPSSPTPLPSSISWRLAFIGTVSVGCLNLSLLYNSVSVYQLFKLLCIPCLLLLQPSQIRTLSPLVLFSLFCVLVGVGLATIKELSVTVHASPLGLTLASLAVLSTAMFQIYSAQLSKHYQLTGVHMNALQSFPTGVLCAVLALFNEANPYNPLAIYYHPYTNYDILLVLATCIISFAVNISSYGILGRLTPVTFQVLGQVKTCCVLIGGWIVFAETRGQINVQNIGGIIIATVSAAVYSILRQGQAAPPAAAVAAKAGVEMTAPANQHADSGSLTGSGSGTGDSVRVDIAHSKDHDGLTDDEAVKPLMMNRATRK